MVAALVTSSKGVAKVSVMLNGTEVSQQTERVPQKSLVVSVPLAVGRELAAPKPVFRKLDESIVDEELRRLGA